MQSNSTIGNLSMKIDTSSLTPTPMSGDECKHALAYQLQPIMDKVFDDNYQKRKILIKKDSINFACPFCRDSATSNTKKRAHFILNGKFAGSFKCFNCGKMMKIANFFNSFDSNVPLSTLVAIKQMSDTSINNSKGQQRNLNITSEVLNKEEALQYTINREQLKTLLNLQEISFQFTPDAYTYLVNRCQYNFNRFLYSHYYKQIFILNLIDDTHILGLQMRDISGKSKVKYKTLTCSKIHSLLLRDQIEVPQYIDNLSTTFNIFNVSLYKTILVTEGPFDAFLLPNCIAMSGANKSLGIDLPFWYIFDSDQTGTSHALALLKNGYNVFMWKKFKQLYNLPQKQKWDITDVFIHFKTIGKDHKQIRWNEFFTSSMLNGLQI